MDCSVGLLEDDARYYSGKIRVWDYQWRKGSQIMYTKRLVSNDGGETWKETKLSLTERLLNSRLFWLYIGYSVGFWLAVLFK